jgi:hypothetical protein
VQATQKVGKHIWEHGQVNTSTWHSTGDDAEEHEQWPYYMQFHPLLGGATDGMVDEIVGIPMAIKGVYTIATDEQQRKALVEILSKEGLSKLLEGLKEEVEEIKQDPEKAQHFGSKTTVEVVTMFFGTGFITKTGKLGDAITTTVTKAIKVVNAKVMKVIKELKDYFKYKPEKRKIIDNYKKDIGEDTFLESIEEAAEDPEILNEVKVRPQKFVDGKKLEKNVEKLIERGDEKFLNKFADEAGVVSEELANYTKLNQVQINLPNGGFTVADNVWIKTVRDTRGRIQSYDVIINEIKLSPQTVFTKRQREFIDAIGKPDVKFTLRNKKFAKEGFDQNIEFNIKSYIRTSGNGTADKLDDLIIKKIK